MTQCLHCSSSLEGLRKDAKYCSRKCANAFHYASDPEFHRARCAAYHSANKDEIAPKAAARSRAWYHANTDRYRAGNMIRRPEAYKPTYDPNRRPFPAQYDPLTQEWERVEVTVLPRNPHFTHLEAALLVIDTRLEEGE